MTNQYVRKHLAQSLNIALLSGSMELGAAASATETKVALAGINETPPVVTAATGMGRIPLIWTRALAVPLQLLVWRPRLCIPI